MAKLDNTTYAEYVAAATPAAKAQVVVDALSGTVTARIRSGASPDAIMATGTMAAPWATQADGVVTVGELTAALSVATGGTPNANWYLEFTNGTRWVTATFGLAGEGREFSWSLTSFAVGQSATLGTVRLTSVSNSAPQWSGAPAALTLTIGGAGHDMSAYASDLDDDPLTFSLGATYTGYSITPQGVLSAGTGATSRTVVVRVSDGALSSDWSVNVTAAIAETDGYPRLGAYWIGSNSALGGHLSQYQSATGIVLMAKRHLVVINGWPELQSWRSGVSNQSIAAAVKAASTKGTQVCVYFDTERVYKDSATSAYATRRAKIAAENWYVYTTGASGTPLNSYFSTDGYAINPTEFVPNDSSGRSAMEWMADYEPSWIMGGAESNTAAPDIDGVLWDNTLIKPRQNADWDRTGGADGGVGDYDPSSTTQRWYREGIAAGVSRFDGTYPAKLNLGNLAEFINFTSTPFPQYAQVFDGGVLEHAIGRTFSIEAWATTTVFVQRIGWVAANVRDESKVLFNCQPDDNSATNYRAFRHALACCTVVTDFCLDYTRETEYLRYYDEYDEYNFNLGSATSGKQTAATSNGIWRRDFDNGIALWCPKGITGTISLGGTFYVLQGNAAAGRTPGSAVTSVTFSLDRDGLILSRAPT